MKTTNSLIRSFSAASAAFALSAFPCAASLIAYEPFDYSLGPTTLDSFSGGSGWSSAWDGDDSGIGAIVSGLSYGALVVSGRAYENFPSFFATPQKPNRSFPEVTSGELWISFLSSGFGTAGSDFTQVVLGPGSPGGEPFWIGESWSGDTLVVQGDSASSTDSGVSTGAVLFTVVKIDFDLDTYSVWVNPTGLGSGSAPTGADFSGSNSQTLSGAGWVALRGSEASRWDELRIGTTWASVSPIPEPATASLAIAATALAALRRRR